MILMALGGTTQCCVVCGAVNCCSVMLCYVMLFDLMMSCDDMDGSVKMDRRGRLRTSHEKNPTQSSSVHYDHR